MNLKFYKRTDVGSLNVDLIGIIDTYISLVWIEDYNSQGSFLVEIPLTNFTKAIFAPEVFVTKSDRNTVMMITTVQIKSGVITATGHMATWAMKQMVATGEIIPEDSEGVNIEQAISNAFAAAQSPDYPFPVVFLRDYQISDMYTEPVSNVSVYDFCEKACKSLDIGFRATMHINDLGEAQYIKIGLFKPDNTIKAYLSEQFGNMSDLEFTHSVENHKNTAYIIGPSVKGIPDIIIFRFKDSTTAFYGSEYAIIVDAKDIEDVNERNNKAAETLRGLYNIYNVKFKPFEKDIGKLYDLGDYISVNLREYGIESFNARVTQYSYTEKKGKKSVSVAIGTPIIRR